MWEVGDTRFLPEELKPEGGGLRYRAVPRHRLPRERSGSPEALTRAEAGALLQAAEHWRDRFLIVLLWYCGLRIGAALGLRRCDVHFVDSAVALGCRLAGPHLHVVPRDNPNRAHAKARRPFSVPVPAEVVAVYERYLLERAEVPVAAACDFVLSRHPDNTYCPEPGVIWTLRPECASGQPLFAGEVRIIIWLYRIVVNRVW